MPALSMKMAAVPHLSRSFNSELHVIREGFKRLSSTPSNLFQKASDCMKRMKINRRSEKTVMLSGCGKTSRFRATNLNMIQNVDLCPLWYASESDRSFENHQRSVETYLQKLQNETKQSLSSHGNDIIELGDQSSQLPEGLISLERYLGNLKEDVKSDEYKPSSSGRNALNGTDDGSAILDSVCGKTTGQKGFSRPRYQKGNPYARRESAASPLYEEKESANLYLISTLLLVNIAVFLFEIASPIKNSDYNLFSLPLMYGAKVNDLIMDGEWWRLVTPMFLHSGVLHIGLSSWALLSFGPQVCKGYGSFTFVLIYVLGGVSGNFASFLQTSEPTVGGSGPVFAVIGTWLIYQVQNKDGPEKGVSETMFQKAVIATAFSCMLSSFGPIDNWTNLGAAISGIIFGYLTSPVLQVEDTPFSGLQKSMKEEITLLRQPASPCKSILIFAVFLSALSSLLLLPRFPLDELDIEEFLHR